MRKLKFILFCFLFLISSSSWSFAQEEKIVAVFPTWKPYGYVENGKATGFEIEIFREVMRILNRKVKFAHQPWKRCLYSMQKGRADVIVSALKVEKRKEYLFYPDEPISLSRTALFTTIDKKILFNGSFENLKSYTIGITRGFSYGHEFDSSDFLQKDESTETSSIVVKVLFGRNELGAGNIAVIKSIAKENNSLERIKFLNPLLHSQRLYVGFSKIKKHQELSVLFSKTLSEFKHTNHYFRIMKKYNMD
ncbi:MAG: transporter substrate-binding domain-containing protein [Desulfobacteraceae bacterium]|nr:transporter substrate-binding domain-containing protein [Desulfobacteraceae bacterium]